MSIPTSQPVPAIARAREAGTRFESAGVALLAFPESGGTAEHVDWLRVQVPAALSLQDYETLCRVSATVYQRCEAQKKRFKTEDGAQEAAALAMLSCRLARPSRTLTDEAYERHSPEVATREVPRADEWLRRQATYPELQSLPEPVMGQYAVQLYTKDGVRHEHRHHARDVEFLAFATLRNFGLDPIGTVGRLWPGLFSLLVDRLRAQPGCLVDPGDREDAEAQLGVLTRAYADVNDAFFELDNSQYPDATQSAGARASVDHSAPAP